VVASRIPGKEDYIWECRGYHVESCTISYLSNLEALSTLGVRANVVDGYMGYEQRRGYYFHGIGCSEGVRRGLITLVLERIDDVGMCKRKLNR
jgi:hypothetical protein